jgi:predicted Zn-dependent peptidase
MERFTLGNGLQVVLVHRQANVSAALLTVKAGSNDESEDISGISHFIEHSVFLGTKRRNALEISSAIETLGGELNAGTTPEQTFYHTKTLPKHLDIALDVLADIVFNPLFDNAQLEVEKGVVAEEISFIYDDLAFYQWVLFQARLFKGPQSRPVFGSTPHVLALTRENVVDFHRRFYVPNNMVLTIVGNIPKNIREIISAHFANAKPGVVKRDFSPEPPQQKSEHIEHLQSQSSYIILGFVAPPRGHPDSLMFDIASGILGRGQSGRLFDELRNKLGLAYSVGAYHNQGYMYNFFAVFANLQEKNILKVKEVFVSEIEKLKQITPAAFEEAKTFIEGDFSVHNDDNLSWAHTITQWELAGGDPLEYVERIKALKLADVQRMAKKYFNDNYCFIEVKPKK